jgi:hypothetical protein
MSWTVGVPVFYAKARHEEILGHWICNAIDVIPFSIEEVGL